MWNLLLWHVWLGLVACSVVGSYQYSEETAAFVFRFHAEDGADSFTQNIARHQAPSVINKTAV
jgi:hypothetical protein